MVNRLNRNPGDFAQTTIQGRISSAPDHVVPVGDQTAAALESVGARLAGRLGQMADKAASREGEQAGMEAGAAAGAKFIEKSAIEARADSKGAAKGKTQDRVTSPPQGASQLNSTPLQLRRDGTIRGEAFDAAAIKSYGWRMQTGLATDLAGALDKYQDDPAGYAGAIDKIRQSYAGEPLLRSGPLREAFEQIYSEKTAIGRLSVAARHEAKLKAAAKAAAVEGLTTMRKSIERDAYNVGGNPAGDAALTQQLSRLEAQIDGAVSDGTLSPAEAITHKKALKNTVLAARTQGTFDALANPEAQADFALSIMDDYASGKGPFAELSLDEAKALSNELYSSAVRNQTAVSSDTKRQIAELETAVSDDVASIAATGQGIENPQLTADRIETLLGTEALATWHKQQDLAQRSWQSTAGMELETPAQLTARLDSLRPKLSPAVVAFDPKVAPGLVEPGTIDINARQVVKNKDGSIGTELSMSFGEDGLEVLIPTIFDGAHHTDEEAIAHYKATGEHLGKFDSASSADAYAVRLHDRQDAYYNGAKGVSFVDQQLIYEAAGKKAAAVLEEREKDPLGQASRAKMIDLTPIDTSSSQALSTSLAQRRIAVEAVSRSWGTPPVVFRPEERKGIVQALTAYPDMLPGFAATVTAQFGELAPIALGEISEAGPELAHVAGIAAATGDSSIAMDVAETLKARADKRSIKMPSDGQLADAAGMIVGPALAAAPGMRGAAIGTANLLLEHEAARLGFDPSEVKKPGSQAADVYARVIDQALGARYVNGAKWGGLTEVNGRQVIAPTFMPAADVATTIANLRDADLKHLPPIDTGNGVMVTAGQIRQGNLVSVGDGQYRVALGDPDSFDPQWLVGANGDYWVLDLDRLRTMRQTEPANLNVWQKAARDAAPAKPGW